MINLNISLVLIYQFYWELGYAILWEKQLEWLRSFWWFIRLEFCVFDWWNIDWFIIVRFLVSWPSSCLWSFWRWIFWAWEDHFFWLLRIWFRTWSFFIFNRSFSRVDWYFLAETEYYHIFLVWQVDSFRWRVRVLFC